MEIPLTQGYVALVDAAARKYFGEYAGYLNFPEEDAA